MEAGADGIVDGHCGVPGLRERGGFGQAAVGRLQVPGAAFGDVMASLYLQAVEGCALEPDGKVQLGAAVDGPDLVEGAAGGCSGPAPRRRRVRPALRVIAR